MGLNLLAWAFSIIFLLKAVFHRIETVQSSDLTITLCRY